MRAWFSIWIAPAAVTTALPVQYGGAVGTLAAVCLALGMLVSYARAKAESLGLTASVGVAEEACGGGAACPEVAAGSSGAETPFFRP